MVGKSSAVFPCSRVPRSVSWKATGVGDLGRPLFSAIEQGGEGGVTPPVYSHLLLSGQFPTTVLHSVPGQDRASFSAQVVCKARFGTVCCSGLMCPAESGVCELGGGVDDNLLLKSLWSTGFFVAKWWAR